MARAELEVMNSRKGLLYIRSLFRIPILIEGILFNCGAGLKLFAQERAESLDRAVVLGGFGRLLFRTF